MTIFFLAVGTVFIALPCTASKRQFTVEDDIEIAHFGDPYSGRAEAVTFSSDRKYFVIDTERGLLVRNRSESTLRVFSSDSARRFLAQSASVPQPSPIWTITKATYADGPIIKQIRWLPDSTGIAFIQTNSRGYDQLFLADLKTKTLRPITPVDQYVTAFDIHSSACFVYIALSRRIWDLAAKEGQSASTVGTGRALYALLFPNELSVITAENDLSELWTVVNGRRTRVLDRSSGQPIPLHYEAWNILKLSPDGRSAVTALATKTVPLQWETSFAPKLPGDPYRIRATQQNVEAFDGAGYVSEYVRINLLNGEVAALTNAPIGQYAGWWSVPLGAAWSADGQSVVLSNTFLPPNDDDNDRSERPCIAIVRLPDAASCLERLRSTYQEASYRSIVGIHFSEDKSRVVVDFATADGSDSSTSYERTGHEPWMATIMPPKGVGIVGVSVRQSLNEPPVLVAADSAHKNARVILDPNPQLSHVELIKATLYRWQDNAGRDWVGGLYKPRGYLPGNRYPLVIQTHGFHENLFRPDGVYPTAFAAQELAASGIVVLQAPDCPVSMDSNEGPCSVALYESAIKHLVADGLVEPTKVGIIGFSRTCYYVMELLTTSKIHITAASITDGVNEGYFQYLVDIDTPGNGIVSQANAMMGAAPFGAGFQNWLRSSPEFNLDKVTTPLQVVATRQFLVFNWEPYAALRVLNRPVDLIVLRNGTHVLSNPAERLASQGGTVDWFRFWLLDVEDPCAIKSSQYTRWRHLRSLQQVGQTGSAQSPLQ